MELTVTENQEIQVEILPETFEPANKSESMKLQRCVESNEAPSEDSKYFLTESNDIKKDSNEAQASSSPKKIDFNQLEPMDDMMMDDFDGKHKK